MKKIAETNTKYIYAKKLTHRTITSLSYVFMSVSMWILIHPFYFNNVTWKDMLTLHLPRFYIFERCSTFSLWSLRQIMVLTLKMGHFIQSIILQPYFLCQRCSHSFVPYVLCPNGTDYLHQLRNFTSKGSCISLPHSY